MSKRERPVLGDTVEFKTGGHNRIGKIVAVAVTKTHFTVETDHFRSVRFRGHWTTDKLRLRVPLSRIVRIIPKEEGEMK